MKDLVGTKQEMKTTIMLKTMTAIAHWRWDGDATNLNTVVKPSQKRENLFFFHGSHRNRCRLMKQCLSFHYYYYR
ncbi:unnamed protein product [Gongylonema pulchrum]|uniref:Poly [ADP-ribose] polymerase n=1 Tax=Gongylonema pulchrum TaxID=637853 RepID=A0A183CY99_9BILA|nr:unnamed protein product [Gongylonema pulchrum]